ncbi:MAG TPA: acetyl-CoA C-acyltransferase [Jatrophihabitantaceae bacterium]|jgi:acetyl-CoA C-acetyltransferase
MRPVVVVDAVRTPIGKRAGGLSGLHSADLLATTLSTLVRRCGLEPDTVEQIVGGCVSQVGMQSYNVTRTAALVAGLSVATAATTVDSQCGSSQQATSLAYALIGSGTVDVAIACGVENMSTVPMGANLGTGIGKAIPKSYFANYTFTSQFQGAELIARKWGLAREELDAFGLSSQQGAAAAWSAGRFEGQLVPIEVPVVDGDGQPTGRSNQVVRDECLRETSMEALAALRPVLGANDRIVGPTGGLLTAGTSSQIADGAAAVMLMSEEAVRRASCQPLARIVDTCLVGSDPVLMLTGPIDATRRLLDRNRLTIDDLSTVEINEAFASVVLAWQRELAVPDELINPNGGAIALGHPLGATGAGLVTKAVHELQRTGHDRALVTMCCGGGLGTATLLERL